LVERPPMDEIKQKILKIAKQEFAQRGFAGARMDEIAKLAKVNKATIYYQIGNKEALYRMVLNAIARPFIAHLQDIEHQTSDPVKQLKCYIEIFVEGAQAKFPLFPIFLRILMDEHIMPLKGLPFPKILHILTSILKKGYKQGIFKKVPAFMVHLQILGVFGMYTITQPYRNQLASLHPYSIDEGALMDCETLKRELMCQVFGYVLNDVHHEGDSIYE